MDFYRKRRARLVVSPSPWSVNTVLLVTVFVVTSGLVYHWGHVAGRRLQSKPVVTDVELLRREWKRQTEQIHADAAAVADESRLQWRLAEAERQEFLDRFLQEQEQEPRPALLPAPPEPPTPIENHEWSRLSQRLARLEQRHAKLLAERTAEHPEVQDVAYEMEEVQQALQGVPQWIRPEGEAVLPESEQHVASLPLLTPESTLDVEHSARKHAEARRQVDRLERHAQDARDRYERLAAAERAAWSEHVREPDLDPAFSSAAQTAPVETVAENPLSTALLAGMAMMVGVAMFAAGAGMEPTLNSVKQISSSLGIPVVATVTLPGLRPTVCGRHRGWLRLASCLGGVVLMVGCLGLVYRSIMG